MVLIDKDSLIEHMRKAYKGNIKNGFKWDLISAVAVIGAEEEITPDAEPIRHGHWLEKEIYDGNNLYHIEGECSVCHNTLIYNSNYCPHCGALMDEVEE